ncbi:MAG TPA: nucleotide exchange factor GrpE [Microbacteriaceae bacterium]|nr:nucleotide exchange factor GrpE [Microbacteriaceae bacterium]
MARKDESPQEPGRPHDGDRQDWHEPVVHDKRRIDPVTGKVRHPEGEAPSGQGAAAGPGEGSGVGGEGSVTDAELDALLNESGAGQPGAASEADAPLVEAKRLAAERLADLQRVTAEFANYRRRTENNRVLERERTVGDVASALLPVLDDLDRAEKHGDLADEKSAFATIAAKLRGVAERLGLTKFGQAGDAFDHNVHDALFQKPDAEVSVDTVAEVVETGYTLGDTLVRAAKVVVATPQGPAAGE